MTKDLKEYIVNLFLYINYKSAITRAGIYTFTILFAFRVFNNLKPTKGIFIKAKTV